MLSAEASASERRMRRRLAVMVAHRPSDRQQRQIAAARADLEALRQLTADEQRKVDEHLARVASEWL